MSNEAEAVQRGMLTKDVKVLSTGFNRRRGALISRGEVTEEVWAAWVDEGIIKLPDVVQVSSRKANRQIRKAERPVIRN